MRFVARLAIGWVVWTGASGAVLRSQAVLTIDRLFIATFGGFLAIATLTLPDRPSRGEVAGVVVGVVAGLVGYGFLVYRRLGYLLSG
jgi:ammonia channel protein AmtB